MSVCMCAYHLLERHILKTAFISSRIVELGERWRLIRLSSSRRPMFLFSGAIRHEDDATVSTSLPMFLLYGDFRLLLGAIIVLVWFGLVRFGLLYFIIMSYP